MAPSLATHGESWLFSLIGVWLRGAAAHCHSLASWELSLQHTASTGKEQIQVQRVVFLKRAALSKYDKVKLQKMEKQLDF